MPESLITYTGQKINKVRWLPKQAVGELEQSTIFITGSYDDKVNSLTVWQYHDAEPMEGAGPDDSTHLLSLTEPKPISSQNVSACVMDMKFIDSEHLGACLLNGSLEVFKYYSGHKLESQFKMDSLHSSSFNCPCTCMATNQFSPGTVYTGGEDGTVSVVLMDQQKRMGRLGENETSCINSMVCMSRSELLVGCSSGQLKLWDIRDKPQSPSMTCTLSKEMTSIQCIDKHPSQSHLIVAGFSNGCICFRDMRHNQQPVNMMTAHAGVVWEVRFHPLYPNYLFSCSQDGSLWQWNTTPTSSHTPQATTMFDSSILSSYGGGAGVTMDTTQQWLTTPTSRSLDVSTVIEGKGNSLSVNSFDIEYKHLVGVTDQEAMYFISNQIP